MNKRAGRLFFGDFEFETSLSVRLIRNKYGTFMAYVRKRGHSIFIDTMFVNPVYCAPAHLFEDQRKNRA
jgi:hypothetical protein